MYFGVILLYTLCLYGPMAVMSVGAGLVFTLWLAFVWKYRKKPSRYWLARQSPLFWPTAAVVGACVWSLVWSALTRPEFYGHVPKIEWIQDTAKLWHILFPLFLAPLLTELSDEQLRKLTLAWLGFAFLAAIMGIVQHYVPLYRPIELPDVGLRGYYHATGMTRFHLSYASIMAFPSAFCFALGAIWYRRHKITERTFLLLALSLIFFIANWFTYSKATWISLPLTILFIAFMGLKGRVRFYILGTVALILLIWSFSYEFRMRMLGSDSIVERVEVWHANYEMILKYPLFGVGWHHNAELTRGYYENNPVKLGFESHAHNNFLDQGAGTGLFGLMCFLWWNYIIVSMTYAIYKNNQRFFWRALGLGLLGGWFCLHINGLTQTNFWDAKVLHQIGWVTALTMEVYRRST